MKTKLSVLAASLACFAAVAPSTASATALAESYLDVTNFEVRTAGGASVTTVGTVTGAANSGSVSATLNGAPPAAQNFGPAPGDFTLNQSQGAGFNPNSLLASASGTYAGSFSSVTGNAVTGSAEAKLVNTVSLSSTGSGITNSAAGVNAGFIFNAATSSAFTFSFNAIDYLISQLTQPQITASSLSNVEIKITNNTGGATVFDWLINGGSAGISGTVGGFVVNSAPFALNKTTGVGFATATDLYDKSTTLPNFFSATTGILGPGNYTVNIQATSRADAAFIAVPEPSSVALVGLGMIGLGLGRRQRKFSSKVEA